MEILVSGMCLFICTHFMGFVNVLSCNLAIASFIQDCWLNVSSVSCILCFLWCSGNVLFNLYMTYILSFRLFNILRGNKYIACLYIIIAHYSTCG